MRLGAGSMLTLLLLTIYSYAVCIATNAEVQRDAENGLPIKIEHKHGQKQHTESEVTVTLYVDPLTGLRYRPISSRLLYSSTVHNSSAREFVANDPQFTPPSLGDYGYSLTGILHLYDDLTSGQVDISTSYPDRISVSRLPGGS